MLSIRLTVDPASQTVTWQVERGALEQVAPFGAVHTLEDALVDARMRGILRLLGYRHVGCGIRPWPGSDRHIQYWQEPEETA
jgi:hypothetical protein